MKITENILTQLVDIDTILDSAYEMIATLDPNYEEEMASYHEGLQTLTQTIPGAEEYVLALQQELASNLRYTLWLGFQWNLECFHNPVNKLMLDSDFEELCQESRVHTLPAAQAALRKAQAYVHIIAEDKPDLLDPILDHYAYIKTWGYKLAFCEGFRLADNLLPHLIPAYVPDTMLTMRLEQKLWDSLGVAAAA
ncbi:MAG: hypothetical protein J6R98_03770 [Bacteroidaceae bacterium]|nr:hypothetical protein [Bacteroidaceae bacterium]